jgi:hypothetical protein
MLLIAVALCALRVLVRRGPVLLLIYALARLWIGEWGEAASAFVFALLPANLNAFASWLEWNAFGRDAWLRRQERDHPHR